RPRVLVLTNAPSPYQSELFSAIHAGSQCEIRVLFFRGLSSSGSAVHAEYPHSVIRGYGPFRNRDEYRLHPRAISEALWGNHDCYVLSGLHTSLTFQICRMILILRRKPWCVWLERPHSQSRAPFRWMRSLRDRLLFNTLNSADRVWCIGHRAKQEYGQL